MKVSREQVAENRRKILATAGKLFREKGFEGVSVADIMAGAGLTHGGFYGYFKNKDELIAHAVAEAASSPGLGTGKLSEVIAQYLSCAHKDNPGEGCPAAALGADIARMTPVVKAAVTPVLQSQIEKLEAAVSEKSGDGARQTAIGTYAALVGALTLARMSNDESLAAEILSATRAFLEERS